MKRSSERYTRRSFVARSSMAVPAAMIVSHTMAAEQQVIVGVMGTGGRGTSLAGTFQRMENVQVAYVCDADRRRAEQAAANVAKFGGRAKPVQDFRRILDDKSVDALVIATPDHWHAPATILACKAGKHVYVEKPCSHNPAEGEMMVAASEKYGRVVQMGTQRRSWPKVREAMQRLAEGVIGEVLVARSWYNNTRPSIGRCKPAPVPEWLDWDLWQGPAPRRPYRTNIVHYNWHWFWHWGTGEIGNNGVHGLDLCRWGLQVDYPIQVSSGGAMLYFDDDQETPDSQRVTYLFENGRMICFDCFNWHPRGFEQTSFGAMFYGRQGTLVIVGSGYRIYDRRNKLVEQQSGSGGDEVHIADFLDSIRTGRKPNATIEEGHKSTLLCHLGSIAHRVGRQLNCRATDGHILDDPQAQALWQREYEPGWQPEV